LHSQDLWRVTSTRKIEKHAHSRIPFFAERRVIVW
jgi:hypothetical protein